MRRLIVSGLVVLGSVACVMAGTRDRYSNDRPALWRSSITDSPINHVLIATGAIHLHEVKIETHTWNNGSSAVLFNSTSIAIGSVGAATAAFINTNAIVQLTTGVIQYFPLESVVYDIPLSSGMVLNKTGNARINILWDYIIQGGNNQVPYKP